MPASISDASGVKVSYSYLSDGTKLSALKPNGEGLVYRGPFVYRRSSGGSLTFESVSAEEGRLSSAGEMLYVEDYFGSVRAVVSGAGGTLLEASNYSAFGARAQAPSAPLSTTPAGITLRDHYTAQEDQSPDFAVPYTDFGARHYNTALRRWMTPDPLSEKYYGISPYAFCAGNPIIFVDRDGQAIDIFADIVSVGAGIYNLYQNIKAGNTQAAWGDAAGIGIDLVCAFIPGVTVNAGLLKSSLKLANWADLGVDVIKLHDELNTFEKASEFGVDSYKNLTKRVKSTYGKGSGLEVHHLIEQRFAERLGLKAGDIPSIVLTTDEHRKFTNLWRESIGYSRSGSKITTNTATKEVILEKVKEIYKDYPEMLKIIEENL